MSIHYRILGFSIFILLANIKTIRSVEGDSFIQCISVMSTSLILILIRNTFHIGNVKYNLYWTDYLSFYKKGYDNMNMDVFLNMQHWLF